MIKTTKHEYFNYALMTASQIAMNLKSSQEAIKMDLGES